LRQWLFPMPAFGISFRTLPALVNQTLTPTLAKATYPD
jgi:hypothetical protein